MRLTNLIRRDVFMTSGELAIPGGVFMAGGGPGGVVGGVRSAYGLLTRPNFGRVKTDAKTDTMHMRMRIERIESESIMIFYSWILLITFKLISFTVRYLCYQLYFLSV